MKRGPFVHVTVPAVSNQQTLGFIGSPPDTALTIVPFVGPNAWPPAHTKPFALIWHSVRLSEGRSTVVSLRCAIPAPSTQKLVCPAVPTFTGGLPKLGLPRPPQNTCPAIVMPQI